MTHIIKKVSAGEILNKVRKSFNPNDSSWIPDIIEDIGWAIQAIGYHTGFETRSTEKDDPLFVYDHRAKIPLCVERILFVEVFNDSLNGDVVFITPEGRLDTTVTTEYKYRTTKKLPLGTDKTLKGISKEAPRTTTIQPNGDYYDLAENGYIVTSFPKGELKIHYKAFAIDKEGLPLIIDDFSYKTCIYWYCVMSMLMSGYKHTEINYAIAERNFDTYLGKAQNAVKVPTTDAMESLINMFQRTNLGQGFDKEYLMNMERQTYNNF